MSTNVQDQTVSLSARTDSPLSSSFGKAAGSATTVQGQNASGIASTAAELEKEAQVLNAQTGAGVRAAARSWGSMVSLPVALVVFFGLL